MVVHRHPQVRQVGLLPGDPHRPLVTATRREHPSTLRPIAPHARRSLVPHGLAPASRQRLQVVDLLGWAVPTVQGAIPTSLRIDADEPPEVQQVLLGVRDGERPGFACPAAVFSGSVLLRVSLPPPAIVLAILLVVLGVVRALAGLAVGRQTVELGEILVPVRHRPSNPALRAPLLRRDWDLIGLSGGDLLPVLAVVRPMTVPAAVIQPVLRALVRTKRSPRLLSLAARAALHRHRLHNSSLSVGVDSSFSVPGTKTSPITRTAGGLVRYSIALSKNSISSLLWPTTSRLHGLQSKPLTIPDSWSWSTASRRVLPEARRQM